MAWALHDFLKPLRKKVLLSLRDNMPAGANWKDWIQQQINAADIMLLVVTADLLGADFTYDELTRWAFNRRQLGKCVVVPVIFSESLWLETDFRTLQALPENGAPIKAFRSIDVGFKAVSEGLKAILEKLEHHLEQQSLEVEKLKKALIRFNFCEQIDSVYAAAAPPHPFSVVVLKGAERGGHHFLAWRWRNEIACAPAARPIPICLTETKDSADEISREIHRCVAGPAHDDNLSYTPAKVASKLFERLQHECLVIRLDDFNHSLGQLSVLEDFFNKLHTELEQLAKKSGAPPHRLWFFLFHRSWTSESDFSFQMPTKIELPPIKAVDEKAFDDWKNDADAQGHFSAIVRTRLTDNMSDILLNQPENNQPLDVLERLCHTVFAKTQLYDEFILTFE
jgi:hypothetical protein